MNTFYYTLSRILKELNIFPKNYLDNEYKTDPEKFYKNRTKQKQKIIERFNYRQKHG